MRPAPLIVLVILLGAAGLVAAIRPQDAGAGMAAQQLALARPGPEHERLARLAGSWNQSVKMWLTPGAEPLVETATSENTLMLGGRFLSCHSKGKLAGTNVEAVNIYGYDRRREVYTLVGLDTLGTYWVTAEGPYDEQSRTAVMYGEDEDPLAGITQKYDMLLEFVDDDTYVTKVIFKAGTFGNEEDFALVEITSTRK